MWKKSLLANAMSVVGGGGAGGGAAAGGGGLQWSVPSPSSGDVFSDLGSPHDLMSLPPGAAGGDYRAGYLSSATSVEGCDGGGEGGGGDGGEGIWSPDIEQAFLEALAVYPPCGRRKIILSDEGKMYGRNELIARYIRLRTGKHRSRKQVSSHIQVLGRRQTKHYTSNFKVMTKEEALSIMSRTSATKESLYDLGGGVGGGVTAPLFSPIKQQGGFAYPHISSGSSTPSHKDGYQSSTSTPHKDSYIPSHLLTPHCSSPYDRTATPLMSPPQPRSSSFHRSLIPCFNESGAIARGLESSPHLDLSASRQVARAAHTGNAFPSWSLQTDINRNIEGYNSHQKPSERHPLGVHPLLISTGSDWVTDLTVPPAWQGRTIAGPKLRLVELSAFVEQSDDDNDISYNHLFVRIDGNTSYDDPLLETIDIRQIQDKFPDCKGGLRDLYERGSQSAFYLVKFWTDMNLRLADDVDPFYGSSSLFESSVNMTIQCSTQVCSFGRQVLEKLEKESARLESGRYVYRFHRSPMCDYLINFISKLRQLPERYMMNSVLENFTVLQVVTDYDTKETLLCIAYVFEVSTNEESGPQHHMYRLTKD